MMIKLKPGKEIFHSSYYEREVDNKVLLHFDNHKDYNNFLNWWILGQLPDIHAPDKIRGLDKPEKGQALGSDSGNESGLS